MRVILEKEEANIIKFDSDKWYIVLLDFANDQYLGEAKVTLEDGIMYADLSLNKNASGYPIVGYKLNGTDKHLFVIGICENKNKDISIPAIEYTKQLEGKPNNLKTK